jgi:hypothetical protein
MLVDTSRSEANIMQGLSKNDEKDEKENMIIEDSENDIELKEYNNNNSNLECSESLNVIEPNNINNNYIFQQQKKTSKNKFFSSEVIREIEARERSFMNLAYSRISLNSFDEESNMRDISNILESEEKQEILETVLDKINRGIIPFFIKFEQFAPIPIYSQKNIRFIDVLQRIQEEIKFEVNSVEFILKGKIIEISNYYNKTIEELGIEPLNIIHAKFKK